MGTEPQARAWLIAARPQTLPAGASPVLVGSALAVHDGVFSPGAAVGALVGALLIQIGTNFANDYYDARRGADAEREGFTRVTESGLLPPRAVKRAMWATFAAAVLVGAYLVRIGGVPILVVGLAGIASGIAYTGGRVAFGYRGLGDPFVFVFFGLVAVAGTYYVQAAAAAIEAGAAAPFPVSPPPEWLPAAAIAAGLPAAGLSTAVLVVNNLRDRETDAAAGKRTLAVRLGERWTRIEWVALVGLAYTVPAVFAADPRFGAPALAPLLTLPLAVRVGRTVLTRTDAGALDPALERTGRLLFAHSALFAVGLAVPVS
jgi:1,4-dihydroxy-2-naphthoate octaprenyltransferase